MNDALMGILNVTPDSFSDGGNWWRNGAPDPALAADYAMRMVQHGAAVIDVGPEATSFHRAGIRPTPPLEQISRAIPVISAIRKCRGAARAVISIDTRSSAVAQAAMDAGATIINDVSAGRSDAHMLKTAARFGCKIILMVGQFETPETAPAGRPDIVQDVCIALGERATAALEAGIKPENILLDPGLGFGKAPPDNWRLLHELTSIAALGYPLVLGLSRKRFLLQGTEFLGSGLANLPDQTRAAIHAAAAPAREYSLELRDGVTAAVTVLCCGHGVAYHRVHNVEICAQAMKKRSGGGCPPQAERTRATPP